MGHTISKVQHWLLKKLIRDNVRQGPHHNENITEMLRLVVESCRDEFYEDNDATQRYFIQERFDAAIVDPIS
jgi:hypothetical protein